jgi:hypothetical protein
MAVHKKTKLRRAYMPGPAIFEDSQWKIFQGRLVPPPGRPTKIKSIFKVFGEKLPKAALLKIKKAAQAQLAVKKPNGVYVAHDSLGYPRYIGRGAIFGRLRSHFKTHPLELHYFSFYIVENKLNEREIETLLIHVAGPVLHFNDRKKRDDLATARVGDFEAQTEFFERVIKRPRKKK